MGDSVSVLIQWARGGKPGTRQRGSHGNPKCRMSGWAFTLTLQLFWFLLDVGEVLLSIDRAQLTWEPPNMG